MAHPRSPIKSAKTKRSCLMSTAGSVSSVVVKEQMKALGAQIEVVDKRLYLDVRSLYRLNLGFWEWIRRD